MWQSWVVAVLGIWVIIEPYLGISSTANKIVLLITGIVILILGIWLALTKNTA